MTRGRLEIVREIEKELTREKEKVSGRKEDIEWLVITPS